METAPPDASAGTYSRDLEAQVAARQKVLNAIKFGALVRGPCETCGAVRTHGHHDDYTKPLSVRWLCAKHHSEWHASHTPMYVFRKSSVRPIKIDWPNHIKNYRHTHRLTQERLAELLEIEASTIQRWEYATRTPPPFLLLALEDLSAELTST